ncbi:DUF4157 domain-containing protein [Nostoc sp. NMS4]|uniref:eCIS core domain-containing protein n=1 Tax=Nostoc sp. NMS4 TaxID=2815390 RepID=UPI0025DCAB60|nr:DUF4157 domain-containing protein [Nostoc sp. NMS4]MBN3925302.1 DUF4157 domain-containing protein [Nostoc sp. NMS4]
MIFQRIQKTASTKTETPTTSRFISRPFAPIIQPPTPTLLQQQEQTERLLQRKTNFLPIPFMPPPKKVIQAKLTIGEPGDEYEQEADTVARQVVQRLHAPMSTKIRQPMEQAFGSDFSGVKVHTDAQSDQLNAKSGLVQRKTETVIQRMKVPSREIKGSTKFPFFKIKNSNQSSTDTSSSTQAPETALSTGITVPQIEITPPQSDSNLKQPSTDTSSSTQTPETALSTGITVPQIEITPPQSDSNLKQQEVLTNQSEAIKLLESKRELLGTAAEEIKRSIWRPEKIDQGQFHFCGSNAFLMAIALNDPVSYMKYIIDLYTAKATYEKATSSKNAVASQTAKLGNMSVNVDQGVATSDVRKFKNKNISQTDWMSMGSIHTQEIANAPDYSGNSEVMKVVEAFQNNGVIAALDLRPTSDTLQKAIMVIKQMTVQSGQTFQSLAQEPNQDDVEQIRTIVESTMPSEITAWFTKYGASSIVQEADSFNPSKTQKDIQKANNYLNASQGKMVMLNINSDTIEGLHSYIIDFDPTKSHWVLMKTRMVINTGVTPNVWEGTVYSWGTIKDIKIDNDQINNSFFGFIAATITTPQSSF